MVFEEVYEDCNKLRDKGFPIFQNKVLVYGTGNTCKSEIQKESIDEIYKNRSLVKNAFH